MAISTGILDFLARYGTLIVAIYGVIQIWLIAIWKHFIWRGRLSIFKTGRIEVNYSNFGPTLAFNGTLRAERKAVFVREITVNLVKQRDGSVHRFEWTAFRSTQLRIGATDPVTLELPAGFNVSPDHPYRYHIFFSDRQTRTELEAPLFKLQEAWRQYFISKRDQIAKTPNPHGLTPETLAANLYDNDFARNSPEYREAWDVLSRRNYWDAGSYRLRFVVSTSAPEREFAAEWDFSLTEQDFELLRLNVVITPRDVCLGQVQYFFAFPEYE